MAADDPWLKYDQEVWGRRPNRHGRKMTDQEYRELEDKLRPRLTDEFLATLVEAAQIDGNGGDWVETKNFVRNVFVIAGKEMPQMKPYDNSHDGALTVNTNMWHTALHGACVRCGLAVGEWEKSPICCYMSSSSDCTKRSED